MTRISANWAMCSLCAGVAVHMGVSRRLAGGQLHRVLCSGATRQFDSAGPLWVARLSGRVEVARRGREILLLAGSDGVTSGAPVVRILTGAAVRGFRAVRLRLLS